MIPPEGKPNLNIDSIDIKNTNLPQDLEQRLNEITNSENDPRLKITEVHTELIRHFENLDDKQKLTILNVMSDYTPYLTKTEDKIHYFNLLSENYTLCGENSRAQEFIIHIFPMIINLPIGMDPTVVYEYPEEERISNYGMVIKTFESCMLIGNIKAASLIASKVMAERLTSLNVREMPRPEELSTEDKNKDSKLNSIYMNYLIYTNNINMRADFIEEINEYGYPMFLLFKAIFRSNDPQARREIIKQISDDLDKNPDFETKLSFWKSADRHMKQIIEDNDLTESISTINKSICMVINLLNTARNLDLKDKREKISNILFNIGQIGNVNHKAQLMAEIIEQLNPAKDKSIIKELLQQTEEIYKKMDDTYSSFNVGLSIAKTYNRIGEKERTIATVMDLINNNLEGMDDRSLLAGLFDLAKTLYYDIGDKELAFEVSRLGATHGIEKTINPNPTIDFKIKDLYITFMIKTLFKVSFDEAWEIAYEKFKDSIPPGNSLDRRLYINQIAGNNLENTRKGSIYLDLEKRYKKVKKE